MWLNGEAVCNISVLEFHVSPSNPCAGIGNAYSPQSPLLMSAAEEGALPSCTPLNSRHSYEPSLHLQQIRIQTWPHLLFSVPHHVCESNIEVTERLLKQSCFARLCGLALCSPGCGRGRGRGSGLCVFLTGKDCLRSGSRWPAASGANRPEAAVQGLSHLVSWPFRFSYCSLGLFVPAFVSVQTGRFSLAFSQYSGGGAHRSKCGPVWLWT